MIWKIFSFTFSDLLKTYIDFVIEGISVGHPDVCNQTEPDHSCSFKYH